MDENKGDMSDENVLINDENPHAGLDPFADHGTDNNTKNNDPNSDKNEYDSGDDLLAPQEGFDLNETGRDGDEMSSANLLSNKSEDEEDEKNGRSLFFKGKRPTSAGEPSANVPRKFNISVICEIRFFVCFLTFLLFLITLFDANWIERSFQSLLHWTNDREKGLGSAALVFCIFDVSILMIAGGADVMLMLGSGFLYGFDVGTILYLICSFIGSLICFTIGKTLYRDAWYQLWSKHETFRLFDRTVQDYGFYLTLSLRLCPFLPMGFNAYLLSFTSVTLRQFMIGQAFGTVVTVAAMARAGSEMDEVDDLTHETYTKDDLSYALIVASSVIFAIATLTVSFLIYQQVHRLLTGDNRNNMERSITETEESETDESGRNESDLEAGKGDSDEQLGDNDNPSQMDIEMAQYNAVNKVENSNNNKNNENKDKKKRKKKKKKKKEKKSFWDDDQFGLAMESPFQEGGGAPRGKFGQQPIADLDAAPMDPVTPRA